MRWIPVWLVVALLAFPFAPLAADPPPKEPPPRTIDELVADLGHPVFAVREKAQRELWARGAAAIPALEKAAKGDDPEAAGRSRELLDKFAWGILPDTPPAVLKLIRQFQAGDARPEKADEVRQQAVKELLALGKPGVSVVRAILAKDLNPESRAILIAQVTALVRREVPLKLVDGKRAEAVELIDLHAVGTTPEGAADYAAFHALQGTLLAAITRAEEAVKSGRRATDAKLVLVYLHRAAGQWAKARAAAEDLPNPPHEATYKELLFEDAGDWEALAELSPGRELNHPDAVRLMHMRLAGRREKFETEAKKVRADADELSDNTDVMDAAVALLSNHRVDDATDLLIEKKKSLGLLSEILITRMRYKEALDLIGHGKLEKDTIAPHERLEFNLRRARVLMMAGHKDDAVQLFNEVLRGLRNPDRSGEDFDLNARALVRTELRVGLRDLACEHGAQFIAPDSEGRDSGPRGESVFELLFPNDAVAADALFAVLRAAKVPGDSPGATMLRVRDILNGTAGKAAVDQAVKLLRESAAALPNAGAPGPSGSPRLMKARRYFALACACRIAGRAEDAEAAFKLAAELTAGTEDGADATGARSWVYGAPDPARVWIEWGEHLADAGRHADAAAVFEAGWRRYPDQPLPLFLSGQALVKAGDVKRGEARIELSHWVGLGNERLRGKFLDELVRRGEGRAIKREVALILKACWSRDHYFGNVMNQCAGGAALIDDFVTAETCGTRSLLVVMRNEGVYFVDTGAYMNVPHYLLVYRARRLLAAGKTDEAMATAREVLKITPGHIDLLTGMVPELDRRDRKKEADELFKLGWDAYQKMLKDYPASAAARHALAQLAGRGNRELDKGLTYAKAAVAADPASVQYREALAEVHFRRGERDDAVKVMQKLLGEQPRHPLLRRQLARYRTAAFDSPWPYTVDGS